MKFCIGNFAVGGTTNAKSPIQIGTDYMTQIEKMTPKVGGGTGYTGTNIGYGSFNPYAYGATNYGGAGGTGTAASPVSTTGSRATLERNGGQLVLHVQNVSLAAGTSARIWLTNTPTISDQTE